MMHGISRRRLVVMAGILAGGTLYLALMHSDVRAAEDQLVQQSSPAVLGQAESPQIVINGDEFKYSADRRVVTAKGNVEVLYKGDRLLCQNATVDMATKDCTADGRVKLINQKGTMKGEKLVYNFETKRGTLYESHFMAAPYYGKAQTVEKAGENEFIARNGHATTCSFDQPHYRIGMRTVRISPGDKIQISGATVYMNKVSVMALPVYNRSLRDRFMHVRLIPGKRSDWGPFVLASWRCNLTDNVDGRVYLDYRDKLGWSEGAGINYRTGGFGKGDVKLYYTDERPSTSPVENPGDYQRSLIKWRHTWDIDRSSNFITEFYKVSDERRKVDPEADFLKTYFYREYEQEAQPLTYALYHRNFDYSSLDALVQMRTNSWFDQIEKKPQVSYSMPHLRVADSPVYIEHFSSLANYNKKLSTTPVSDTDEDVTRFDMMNKFSLPTKVAFVQLSPFVANRQTAYDKGAVGNDLPIRSIFYGGVDASTKFFRIYDVNADFLGVELHQLRHIITPTIGYSYNPDPTVTSNKLKQIDAVDEIARSDAAKLELSNKLQTKRDGATVDLLDTRVSSVYRFNQEAENDSRRGMSDILTELTALPYRWLRIDADATYTHSGLSDSVNYNTFSSGGYDFYFGGTPERTFGIGQRYERKVSSQVTYSLNWRLTPKWRFEFYNRYEIKGSPELKRGMKEQEYTLSRDLHCWVMDLSVRTDMVEGDSFWIVFHLKAFPESQFNINQSYHQPRSSVQGAL